MTKNLCVHTPRPAWEARVTGWPECRHLLVSVMPDGLLIGNPLLWPKNIIAMPSSKASLLISSQLGQVRAVKSIPGKFRYHPTSRRAQSTLCVPTSRTTRRPFSYPYHLRPNLPTGIRNIFIQTESTPNVDVSQPDLWNLVVLIYRLWNFSQTIQFYHQNYLQNFWSTYPQGRL